MEGRAGGWFDGVWPWTAAVATEWFRWHNATAVPFKEIKGLSMISNGGIVRRMRGWGIALCALGLLAAHPAVAGTLYRCDGADGGRSYVSKRIPGAKCVAISNYQNVRRAPASPAPTAS